MSFLTCFWLFPQNEHLSRSPPSPMRATPDTPLRGTALPPRSLPSAPGLAPGRNRHPAQVSTLPSSGPLVSPPGGESHRNVPNWAPFRCGNSSGSRDRRRALLAGRDDVVDQPVRLSLLGVENLVALDVLADF